jgi:hypothetical protein
MNNDSLITLALEKFKNQNKLVFVEFERRDKTFF